MGAGLQNGVVGNRDCVIIYTYIILWVLLF